MSTTFKAYAALEKGGPLVPFEFDPGPLGDEEVEIRVRSCGLCHSDLSMLDNEWGDTVYPFVPGHEVVGDVVAVGKNTKRVSVGDRVGLGWLCGNCMACHQCLGGNQNLCSQVQQTIVGRYGGFADRVRCQWQWAVPLPEGLDAGKAGPLFCGGITVFTPLVECGVKPTDRVGVIGIGGLGHLALQLLDHWGCEVTAFTSEAKLEEALKLGADRAVNSRDPAAVRNLAGSLDFILSTVNVPLDWSVYLDALAPKGRLHFVGVVAKPISVPLEKLLRGERSISSSPLGNLSTLETMLQFCARHGIAPIVERFPMSHVNEAFEHLRSGKARYRIILDSDFS